MISDQTEAFARELADMLDAEHQFLEAQQLMLLNATDPTLKGIIEHHMVETQGQIDTLLQVFAEAGKEPERGLNAGARGLIEESESAIDKAGSDAMRDAFIAGNALKAEHYEMVNYVDLIEDAEALDLQMAVELLSQSCEQEARAARLLEAISERLGKRAA